MGQMIHIHDGNWQQFAQDHVAADGTVHKRGAIPRPYNTHPVGCYAAMPVFSLPLMDDAAIQAAIIKKNADKSWLSDLRMVGNGGAMIPSRDQNGRGYCWFHSGVSAHLLARARDNDPYEDLSAYAGACIIKNYRDEGGWGQEGVDWQIKNGCPTSKTWPQQATNRNLDTPAMRAEAAKYKPTGTWMDMRSNDDRALATCLCQDIPVVVDYDWWSHSVCACRLISWNPLSIWIWNSWGDSWSDNGFGLLSGRKASADGQVALTQVSAAA